MVMPGHHALIIDDEVDICELLELTLNRMDIKTHSANNISNAIALLSQHPFTICLTDMKLPDGNGIEIVKHIKQHYPHIPVAMISAHGNMEHAIEALKAGAFDFVSKPMVLSELRNLVNSAIKLADSELDNTNTTTTANSRSNTELNNTNHTNNQYYPSKELLGDSHAIREVRQLIIKLSKSLAPVHISGESGTGKELAARLIHQNSPRRNSPFIPINCGAIPSELMESEFFGHKKGSFTGATKNKIGLFQAADGGTLFLDEIADLPLSMQVKLLRAIQEKSIRPIGEELEKKIDVRIISATHKNLQQLVLEDQFRQDLFYRINVIQLAMPNLRDYIEDIPVLSKHFLAKLNNDLARSEEVQLDLNAIKTLQRYDFPGNIRELENILERASALCENNIISVRDLNLPETPLTAPEALKLENEEDINKVKELPDREKLIVTLDATKWNRKAAASILGITYRQLRYRLKKFNLE